MNKLQILKSALACGASVLAIAHPASAKVFNIPDGDLATALVAYMKQSNVELVYVDDIVHGHKTHGAKGDYTETAALTQILRGTGFTTEQMPSNAIGIVPEQRGISTSPARVAQVVRRAPTASAAAMPATVETVVVTAQKKSENIQNVPIAVTALSQAQLTERQIAGGPDLVKEVPNLTFSKTNFTGYNLEIRGIGTQAISVTTDPAVAVAFNDIPFIRNHFFEQEFYDLQDVEVLRGPQGTLYGRNATAGVVNIKSALPTDQFEAMASADLGNYSNRRLEGMINLPIASDKLDLRLAGEWTKRDGYSFNTLTNQPVDGRDLWSGRASLRWRPDSQIDANLVWEHFSEDDNRMRTSKQLCKTDPRGTGGETVFSGDYISQGCLPASLYSPDSFEVPNGFSLPYYAGIGEIMPSVIKQDFDPYASTTQSTNLRDIESRNNPIYRAKNDTIELNVDYTVTPALTLTSQTGYNHDFLYSTEDYNRFNTAPGIFVYSGGGPFAADTAVVPDPIAGPNEPIGGPGVFCDPQLGCSDRLIAQDLSDEHAWQASQEFRLASSFSGPLNFSVGTNFLHYETVENYYVFINTLSLLAMHNNEYTTYVPGVTDNHECLQGGFRYPNPQVLAKSVLGPCYYMDPNPLGSINSEGHNYFLSQNPYVLNSYATFGEVYYDLTKDLKLTGGLRWTEDQKHFLDIPSETILAGWGYPVDGIVDQQWHEITGRSVISWTPEVDFTDSTLIYGSYAHGYKAGGANPPGASFPYVAQDYGTQITDPIHPLTFKPEHIESFELGTKNTVLDGSMTLNGDVFYYNYHDYQISRIVDRTAINDNFNAHVLGAEVESTWEPLPGLRFNLAAGWEDARVGNGMESVDLIDRTAGHPGWMLVKPFVSEASNCILPTYVNDRNGISAACDDAYGGHVDPRTTLPYVPGNCSFDPLAGTPDDPYHGQNTCDGIDYGPVPNNGAGFDKNLSGHWMPNAPPVTFSFGTQYTIPVSNDWAATLRGDFYYQADSWARVFNDRPYDQLRGYTNLNLALLLDSGDGWEVMGYVKNVFNVTAITGDFLNSDDTGLTTNVFLTDPRLYGVRVTKNFGEGDTGAVKDVEDYIAGLFADADNGRPPLWITLGGGLEWYDNQQKAFSPSWSSAVTIPAQQKALDVQSPLTNGLEEEAKISYQPDGSDWIVSAAVRYGRSSASRHHHQQTANKTVPVYFHFQPPFSNFKVGPKYYYPSSHVRFADGQSRQSERHLLLDFQAGKDVGLGMFGLDGTSVVSAGVRIAQLQSRSSINLRAEPDVHYPTAAITSEYEWNKFRYYHAHFHDYGAGASTKRSFHGIGPSLSWNASTPIAGNPGDGSGELDVDWGLNGALLFGRQNTSGHHKTSVHYYDKSNGWFAGFTGHAVGKLTAGHFDGQSLQTCFGEQLATAIAAASCKTNAPPGFNRSRNVTVPNLGFAIGASYRYQNAKISFGYRADFLFGAMDGGVDTYKSENRGFFGPYANINIGLGG